MSFGTAMVLYHRRILLTAIVALLECYLESGADLIPSLIPRLECYKSFQEGCNTSLIDAYPDLKFAYDKKTKATTDFYLFTKESPDDPELLHQCGANVPPKTTFNPNKCRTEIFIPGFGLGVCNCAIYRELKNERLKSGCYNVILVDWMWGNSFHKDEENYNMKIVANQVAILIKNLKQDYNLTADDFILTGHDNGAHLAGFVGQLEDIGIINGLDPAGGVVTELTSPEERLDASDAECVHVMHCNAGPSEPNFFGVNFTCGDIDFWINGGSGLDQKESACSRQVLLSFAKADYIYALLHLYPPACHHLQCLEYYKASMNPTACQFLGVNCGSNAQFQAGFCRSCGPNGEHCSVAGAYACDCLRLGDKTGSYYLNTGPVCPFCDNSEINKNGYRCPDAMI